MQSLTIIFSEYTGGQDGLNGLDPMLDSTLAYYYLTLFFLALTAVILKLLANSPWGTLLRAIRGDEASCQAAGINVTFYKIASLTISAAVAGLGGVGSYTVEALARAGIGSLILAIQRPRAVDARPGRLGRPRC